MHETLVNSHIIAVLYMYLYPFTGPGGVRSASCSSAYQIPLYHDQRGDRDP